MAGHRGLRRRGRGAARACFVWDVAKSTAEQQLSKTLFLMMLTAPPPVLIAMPAPAVPGPRRSVPVLGGTPPGSGLAGSGLVGSGLAC